MLSPFSRHEIDVSVRVGIAVCMPLLVVYTSGRMDLSAYAALGTLTSLYGHAETSQQRCETLLVAAITLVAIIAVATILAAAHAPLWLLGVALVMTVAGGGTLGVMMRWVPRGEMFFVLALLVISGVPIAWPAVLPAISVAAAAATFSVLVGIVWRPHEDKVRMRLRLLHRRALAGLASLDFRQHCIVLMVAATGVLTAWVLAIMLGVGHPFWAAVTVASLMPALASPRVYRRLAHFVLGSALGVAAAMLVYLLGPDRLTIIAIIAVAQIAMMLFIGRHYWIALVFLSPLAIGMSNLGRDLPWKPLLLDRVSETGLGACVAFATTLLGRRLLRSANEESADEEQITA